MKKLIVSYAGNTEEVALLRQEITEALLQYEHVFIKLGQPGLTYKVGAPYLTTFDFVKEFDPKKCTFFANCIPLIEHYANFHYINDMFFEGWDLYNKNAQCRQLLESCLAINKKSTKLRFDLLLGEWNATKDTIAQMIKSHPVIDKTFFTYYGKDVSSGSWSDKVMRPKIHTAETFIPKSQIRCSDLLDPEIYNQTYYSAMVETNLHPTFAMFSEKEAKPIVAKRPFVIFGSPGHLNGFKKLGFKTFSPVIDESYDNEPDMIKRFALVLNTMHELSLKDPVEVHNKLANVLEHNKNHFEKFDWNKEFRSAQAQCR